VEPPGIFRGRGEHPHAGRIKQRVVPEFVSLNIGDDNPIPICPIPGHSWKKIVSNPDATWLCHFKDERSKYANGKYVFLAAESKIKGENDKKKYEKARRLKERIDSIRVDYTKKIKSDDIIDNQIGICTYLIDNLALRVGNEKGEDEADTVGCCSLKVKNVEFPEVNFIKLDFLGKDSIRYENTVQVPEHVYKKMQTCHRGKAADDLLFDRINTGRLNDYLKSHMEDLSAKVFRTYNASITLQN
jgi:DNA topoisomerase-1